MQSLVDVRETIEKAKDTMSVRRVFGEPVEKDGVTVIPRPGCRAARAAAAARPPRVRAPAVAAGSP